MASYLFFSVIIGLVATMGMTAFLWIVKKISIYDVDMVRAIGSYLTRNEKNALIPGILLHFTSGVIFSFAYIILFNILPVIDPRPYLYISFGGLLGFVHGLVMAVVLVFLIAETHPLPKYKKASFAVAVFHFLAHIIYGLLIGFLFTYLLTVKGVPIRIY
jgi:hypothetical protein